MASTLGYHTEVDLENLLLVDIDSSFSSQIDTWISASEHRVNNYLGFTTASGLWNESVVSEKNDCRVDGDGNLVIHTRKRPINSVSAISIIKGTDSVNLDLTDSAGATRYVIPVQGNVIVYPTFELSTTSSTTLYGFMQVKYSRFYTKVSYIAGYTSIPEDIQLATTLFTADTFMRQANKENLVSISQGRITKRWQELRDGESNYIREAKEILNHYKIASGYW